MKASEQTALQRFWLLCDVCVCVAGAFFACVHDGRFSAGNERAKENERVLYHLWLAGYIFCTVSVNMQCACLCDVRWWGMCRAMLISQLLIFQMIRWKCWCVENTLLFFFLHAKEWWNPSALWKSWNINIWNKPFKLAISVWVTSTRSKERERDEDESSHQIQR